MAPEQAADPHAADIRADVDSLGCTLYFLLTGQPLFPQGTLVREDRVARQPAAGSRRPSRRRPAGTDRGTCGDVGEIARRPLSNAAGSRRGLGALACADVTLSPFREAIGSPSAARPDHGGGRDVAGGLALVGWIGRVEPARRSRRGFGRFVGGSLAALSRRHSAVGATPSHRSIWPSGVCKTPWDYARLRPGLCHCRRL